MDDRGQSLPPAAELAARRGHERSAAAERDAAARARQLDGVPRVRQLLEEFVQRARELRLEPEQWSGAAVAEGDLEGAQGYPIEGIDLHGTEGRKVQSATSGAVTSYQPSTRKQLMVTAPSLRLRRLAHRPRRRSFAEWRRGFMYKQDKPLVDVVSVEETVTRVRVVVRKSFGDTSSTYLSIHDLEELPVLMESVGVLPQLLERSLVNRIP